MTNEDLKKLQESKTELFEGIGRALERIGLGHLHIAGLELEPSSIQDSSDKLAFGKGDTEVISERFTCPKGYVARPVVRVDPRGRRQPYTIYICVPDNK